MGPASFSSNPSHTGPMDSEESLGAREVDNTQLQWWKNINYDINTSHIPGHQESRMCWKFIQLEFKNIFKKLKTPLCTLLLGLVKKIYSPAIVRNCPMTTYRMGLKIKQLHRGKQGNKLDQIFPEVHQGLANDTVEASRTGLSVAYNQNPTSLNSETLHI